MQLVLKNRENSQFASRIDRFIRSAFNGFSPPGRPLFLSKFKDARKISTTKVR